MDIYLGTWQIDVASLDKKGRLNWYQFCQIISPKIGIIQHTILIMRFSKAMQMGKVNEIKYISRVKYMVNEEKGFF